TNDTSLTSRKLQMTGKFYRFGSNYAPPGIDLAYKGDLHYPAVYNGSFSFENPQANLVQREDLTEPYVRISNEGYWNSSIAVG
ncbi:hypothetical protein FO522_33700, partial [Bacillus nitratireducens]|nr:hypothetical protein [Bacillus nitratireducens]